VATATDRQLIKWRDELEATIRKSPIARDPTDQLVALDGAIAEARETAVRLGTSGAQAQVQHLETQRAALAEEAVEREAWLEGNAHLLRRYSAVAEELPHRIRGLIALYEVAPPQELLDVLGPKPRKADAARQWMTAVGAHAEARLTLGPGADLLDAAVLAGGRWRDTLSADHLAVIQELESSPLLRRAM
jgi:hypothetical protein